MRSNTGSITGGVLKHKLRMRDKFCQLDLTGTYNRLNKDLIGSSDKPNFQSILPRCTSTNEDYPVHRTPTQTKDAVICKSHNEAMHYIAALELTSEFGLLV